MPELKLKTGPATLLFIEQAKKMGKMRSKFQESRILISSTLILFAQADNYES